MWRNGTHRAFAPQRTVHQFGVKAGTHFTDPDGMEGWVDPLLLLGLEPVTTGTRKESQAPSTAKPKEQIGTPLYSDKKCT